MPELTTSTTLTPLERLQLRDALQDRWRQQVTEITELSVDLHTALDSRGDDADRVLDATAIATALSNARLRLVEIEQAMHRLDDRSYGRCSACLMPISLETLSDEPEARYCEDCRTRAIGSPAPAMANAGR